MKIHVLIYGREGKLSDVSKIDLGLLEESAKKQGHELEVIYSYDCQMKFNGKPGVLIKNKIPKDIKTLLVKANFLVEIDSRSALIKQFQLAGIDVINKHFSVLKAKNKVRTMQVLSYFKVPIPKTYTVTNAEYLDEAVRGVGKFPLILKTATGSHGAGVSIIESRRALKSIIEMLSTAGGPDPVIILQEYVKESKGKDIRVFIVGGKIVAAMERIATKRGEFRSNFHLGGKVKIVDLSLQEKKIAKLAVKAVGLDMAGVDILRTNDGPEVLEVNANPGLEGITEATGLDVAGQVIKYVVKRSKQNV